MGVWNIHAALNFAFLLQQNIIYCKVALESGRSKCQNMNTIYVSARQFSKPQWGNIVSYIVNSEWGFHTLSIIIKRQKWDKVKRCHLVMEEHNVSFCMLSFRKDQLPIQMEGGVAIWQFWLSKTLSSDVLVSQHRPKWIDLLIVLSSYWNTICSMACRQGGLTVQIEFSCRVFSFQP